MIETAALPLSSPIWWAFVLLLVIAMVTDVRSYQIPNWIVGLLFVGGFALVVQQPVDTLVSHGVLALAGLAAGFLLYAVAGMGAGDAKLLAAVLLWSGPSTLYALVFWLAIACVLLVIGLLSARAVAPRLAGERELWKPLQKNAPVPFALAISTAAILASPTFPEWLW